jgi:hypothetical protein
MRVIYSRADFPPGEPTDKFIYYAETEKSRQAGGTDV